MSKQVLSLYILQPLWTLVLKHSDIEQKSTSAIFIESAQQMMKQSLPLIIDGWNIQKNVEDFKRKCPLTQTTLYIETSLLKKLTDMYTTNQKVLKPIYTSVFYYYVKEREPEFNHLYFNAAQLQEQYQFTQQDYIKALSRIEKIVQHFPTARDIQKHRLANEPSYYHFMKYYHRWDKVKREVKPQQGNQVAEGFKKALTRMTTELKHIPNVREYSKHRLPNEPSLHQLYKELGGYKPRIGNTSRECHPF